MIMPRKVDSEMGTALLDIDRRLRLLEGVNRTSLNAKREASAKSVGKVTEDMLPDRIIGSRMVAPYSIGSAHIGRAAVQDINIRNISGDKIVTGTIRAINVFASAHVTRGTYLTAAASAADTTLYVEDTSDFSASGSGWLVDSTNDRDAFSWTGKTSTTLTGCSGVLAHNIGALVIPASKSMVIDDITNEMRFYGDRGDTTIEELASIGVKQDGSDFIIGSFGSLNSGNSRFAIYAASDSGRGIKAITNSGYAGVFEAGPNGRGIYCSGGLSPIIIQPSSSASAPSHGAPKGSLWVASDAAIYENTDGSTTWLRFHKDFGAWSTGYTPGTAYLAVVDYIVTAYSASAAVAGYSDSSNPPTTLRAQAATGNSITFPVRRGEYFKVTGSGAVIQLVGAQ